MKRRPTKSGKVGKAGGNNRDRQAGEQGTRYRPYIKAANVGFTEQVADAYDKEQQTHRMFDQKRV